MALLTGIVFIGLGAFAKKSGDATRQERVVDLLSLADQSVGTDQLYHHFVPFQPSKSHFTSKVK